MFIKLSSIASHLTTIYCRYNRNVVIVNGEDKDLRTMKDLVAETKADCARLEQILCVTILCCVFRISVRISSAITLHFILIFQQSKYADVTECEIDQRCLQYDFERQ